MDFSNYSGSNGLYLKSEYENRGLPFQHLLGATAEKSLHMTLMCSRVAPRRSSLTTLYAVLAQPLEVEILKVAWIAGHNDLGYLVAEISSMDAHDRHDLLTKIGCQPQWGEEFYPHITLIKHIGKSKARSIASTINAKIASKPLKLTLTRTICMDLC